MFQSGNKRRNALALQGPLLAAVSRTFALTIPELPEDLELAVGNAYLLCRAADVIEDDPAIAPRVRDQLHDQLVRTLDDQHAALDLARLLPRHLSAATPAAERWLIRQLPEVIAVHAELPASQRETIRQCVATMCNGMAHFQRQRPEHGLSTMAQMDGYCYSVAGVVGEMLTKLFADACRLPADRRTRMLQLSTSFGQGLQLTNILKDVWEDRSRGYCWLPRDLFSECGYDLDQLAPDHDRARFNNGLTHLIGIAHGHLRLGLEYTLMLPRKAGGIRRFCLWSLGLAVLTLRRIAARPNYAAPAEVKVSRRTVAVVMVSTRLTASQDRLLRAQFGLAARSLPLQSVQARSGSELLSRAGVAPAPTTFAHPLRQSS